jgi:hypothetical protein
MNDEATTSALNMKLDTLIKLMALAVAPESQSLKDRAVRLTKAGLPPKVIAELCDTTPNTVSVALSAAKREKKAKNKR